MGHNLKNDDSHLIYSSLGNIRHSSRWCPTSNATTDLSESNERPLTVEDLPPAEEGGRGDMGPPPMAAS